MPYKLDGNCVYKVGQSEALKCYDNHADALAYLRALEANVNDTKSFQGLIPQAECNYVPLSTVKGKACASCRWFLAQEQDCFICADYPETIMATGYCDRWEAQPVTPEPEIEPTPVVIVEPPMMEDDSGMMKAIEKPGTIERIWKALQPYLKPDKPESAFTVFKGTDGQYYWHAVFTNNYEDREGETLSAKAHERYEKRVNAGLVPMPELWTWHTPGTKHGQADAVWFNDHFMHAIGHFEGTAKEIEKHVQFYSKNAVKLSHGFTAPEWAFKDGVFEDYNTFEITTLPPKAAANVYTDYEVIKDMALSEEKRRWIESQFGKEKLTEIEAADNERAKSLEALKVAYKDFADMSQPTPAPENDKALSAVYADLVATQDELLEIAVAQSKAFEAMKAETDKREKARDEIIAQLAKALNTREKPSESSTTELTPELAALFNKANEQGKLPTAPDAKQSFYGVPMKASN